MNKNVWVYDLETCASLFTYTGFNIHSEEIVQFVLHKDRFELGELIIHLESCEGQIGFNNVNFDYSILHCILKNCNEWIYMSLDKEQIISKIYNEAQRIIEEQNKELFTAIVGIKQKDVLIPQLDLFKLWHYNNKARATSLKALEISMNYPNVMEMSIDHTRIDIQENEIQEVLEYNLNDVLATYEFYKKSLAKIELRKNLKKTYRIPCTNYSDSKIGEDLVLKLYCDKTGSDYWETKKLRTHRESISVKNIIFNHIKFETPEFEEVLKFFKNLVVTNTKGSSDKSCVYNNFKYDFGLGGIHGCIKSGIYQSDENYIIKSCDVSSLYPTLAIKYELFPAHLGHDFVQVYESILEMRIQAKKASDAVLSDGYKLALNSCYGKSNDVNSFLYDPRYTLSTTINGQLMLAILAERLNEIPDCQMIMINTDGLEIKIPRQYEPLYYNICSNWEIENKLTLEFNDYQKMWIGDVNNYGCLDYHNKVKNKGRFEVDKVVGNERAYHKDNSFKIIPLALQEYFVNNIPVEETIKNHKNIYDFCGRQKFKRDSYGQIHYLKDNKEVQEKQQKNTRYYISNLGATFVKYYIKGTTEMINKGYKVTIFNKFTEGPYDINYQFYINECMKEIRNIENKQLYLFT